MLPIALMFSAVALAKLGKTNVSYGQNKASQSAATRSSIKTKLAVLFLLGTNLPMALYMSMVHQVHSLLTQHLLSSALII